MVVNCSLLIGEKSEGFRLVPASFMKKKKNRVVVFVCVGRV